MEKCFKQPVLALRNSLLAQISFISPVRNMVLRAILFLKGE